MSLQLIGILLGAFVFALVLLAVIVTKTFHRASKEQAFVRTGMGGQKVVKDGGAVVLPMVHETIPINMQTLRLTVQRGGNEGSLITKDRLRVDVKAEFYVRVAPDVDSIATAAQTLGRRTLAPEQLSVLIEGKFVDALRAAAASMDMQDLHEKRSEFVQKVQNTVAEDLKKNGLELESVSLTGLDQTDIKHFNPNNAFDAEGLAKLTAVTETRRRERNEIEADARVAIETKNLEANSKSLELAQAQEFARLEQEREVETRRAEQEAQLAAQRADRKREAETAEITAAQLTEQARVAKERAIKVAETEAAQALEIAAQASRIAVAEKSEAESKARAAADAARAEAVRAAEAVKTVEAEAQAQRNQKVQVIAAETKAQESAAGIRIKAEADLAAADAQAKAQERLSDAERVRYEVEAEGKRAVNEAGNVVSQASMEFSLRQALINNMPQILEAMGKPMEKIDSFKVVHVNGMGGMRGSIGADGEAVAGPTNLPGQIMQTMSEYQMVMPFVQEMAQTLKMDLSQGMNGVVAAASAPLEGGLGSPAAPVAPAVKPASRVKPAVANREAPLDPAEKASIQKLAGITPEGE